MRKSFILMFVTALLAFSGGVFAASVSIVNGDFETGSDNDAPPAGWTDNSSSASFWLGVAGEDDNPTVEEASLAPGGLGNFFLTTGRQSAGVDSQPVDGQLVQAVDLSELATNIDADIQNLHVDFIYASDDDRDTGTFSLHFFSSTDGTGTELGSGYSVNLDAGEGYTFSGWQEMTVGGLVPVGARSVLLQIDTTRSGGSATNIWIDNISLRDAAWNPSPTGDFVDILETLSWDPPETYTGATYDVYFGTTEPNFNESAPYGLTLIGTPGQTAATATPVPSPMVTDTTYYWVVDTYEPNDLPILHPGSAWSFTTIPSTPQINPQPQNTYFSAGDPNVVLSLTATTTFPPMTYQWYKDASPLSDIAGEISGATDDTLVIVNPDISDEGSYYCTVTGDNGGSTDSSTAIVLEKRMVAWYQFENNTTDSIGIYDANEPAGAIAYAAGVPGLSGQTYAADPNGSVYGQLAMDAYPKPGFGNALEEGAIAFWAKTDATSQEAVLGSFNDDSTTGLQIWYPSNGGTAEVYLRDGDGTDLSTGDAAVNDNQWHYVVVTYDADNGSGSTTTVYVDGEPTGTNTDSILDNFAAWQYPMVLMARNNRGSIESRFSGMLDDLRIYNYALTDEEIAQAFYDVTGQPTCIAARYGAQYDFDNNCIFDLSDLAVFFGMWLDTGWYPVMP